MKTEAIQKELVVIANEKKKEDAKVEAERNKAEGNNAPPKEVEVVAESRAGTTCTVVLITEDKIICANAGDSRTVYGKEWTTKDQEGKGLPLS